MFIALIIAASGKELYVNPKYIVSVQRWEAVEGHGSTVTLSTGEQIKVTQWPDEIIGMLTNYSGKNSPYSEN